MMTQTLLLAALWRASWQGGVFLALLWGLCRVLENRVSPSVRGWLWRAGYLRLLFGLLCATTVGLPLLPAPRPSAPISQAVPFAASKPIAPITSTEPMPPNARAVCAARCARRGPCF